MTVGEMNTILSVLTLKEGYTHRKFGGSYGFEVLQEEKTQ